MKTCRRFTRIKADFEQDIRFLRNYSECHQGTAAAKASAKNAHSTKQRMAKALSRHFEKCPECG
ncbi:MAG: hypothetical protein JO362_10380 [Streptomycetaceae bacterium]|nr:hypothetical protein [Streptomycetaceae bacterium]